MFKDRRNEVIMDYQGDPLRLGCNKGVGAHNDLNFSDAGVPSIGDTACSDQPTVTVTIGACRRLFFHRLTKKIDQRQWSTLNSEHSVSFDLNHGSIFVLSPEDGKPRCLSRSDPTKYKTKHGVEFKNDGVSFAFVFRRVNKTGQFNRKDNTWLWHREGGDVSQRISLYIKNNVSEYDKVRKPVREMEKKKSKTTYGSTYPVCKLGYVFVSNGRG